MWSVCRYRWRNFYPRPPRGGRLGLRYEGDNAKVISIHALREEGDRSRPLKDSSYMVFLSTPSARRATIRRFNYAILSAISIHALREEGDSCPRLIKIEVADISIHALREEGDTSDAAQPDQGGISIHALREEGDNTSRGNDQKSRIFLSTPSARRATPITGLLACRITYFYPRPPRGGRLFPGVCYIGCA